MSVARPFVVGERVEAAFDSEPTAFYPGLISKVREKGRYDVQFDDDDVRRNVRSRLIRRPAWWWVDEGEPGMYPHTRCHMQVRYTDPEGKVVHLKSGDLVVLRNGSKASYGGGSGSKRWSSGGGSGKNRDEFFVAEVLCFFEEYDEEHVEPQRLRAQRYPCARFVLDTDMESAKDGSFPRLFPSVEVRFFYFPDKVFKDKSALQPFLSGELFETDDVAAGVHLDDVLCTARVEPDREAYLNNCATQDETQADTQSDGCWGGDDRHLYLCQHFYDTQAKRLRRIAFNTDDPARGRKYSRYLFQAVAAEGGVGGCGRSSSSSGGAGGAESRSRCVLNSPTAFTGGGGGAGATAGADRDAAAGGARKRARGSPSSSSSSSSPGVAQRDRNLFMLAYNELQLSAVPHSLPCRETERRKIYAYLRRAITTGGRQSTLYVSGLPGTGKTATVLEVVRILGQEVQSKSIPAFKFVMLNAMQLTHPLHAYRDILFKITGEVKTAAKAAEALKQVFSVDDPSRPTTLLVVDEIDCLSTRKQEVLYNLFEWPSMKAAKLLVVGIANTMDLPQRLLPKISSRASLERVDFAPYTKQQIVAILKSRLDSLPVFTDDALDMCAHKVTAVSGDIRRALQLCRRAIELRENGAAGGSALGHHDCASGAAVAAGKAAGTAGTREARRGKLDARDISKAAISIRSSHHYKLVQNASYFERVALTALARAQQYHGVDTVEFPVAARQFQTIVRTRAKELPCPRGDEILLVYLRLCEAGLVIESRRSSCLFPLLTLAVPVEDVQYGLRNDKDKLFEFLKTRY